MAIIKKYTNTAILLHWLIGIGVIFMLALGMYMHELPKPSPEVLQIDIFDWGVLFWHSEHEISVRAFYFNLHKSIGLTLLALILIRVYWRVKHTPPVLPPMTTFERILAKISHHTLYVLMVAMPLSGIMMALNSKYGLTWFGIPLLSGLDNKEYREFFMKLHELISLGFFFFIALHIMGALKHQLISRDNLIARMWFHNSR